MLDVSDWVMRACCRDFGASVIGVRVPDLALSPIIPAQAGIQNSPQRGVCALLTKLRSTRFTVATLWDLDLFPPARGRRGMG